MRLVAQTPTVPRTGTFELRLAFDGIPADGSVRLILHDRVRSRSELAASRDGEALRRELRDVTTPISTLPTGPESSRRVTLSFDPAAPTGIRLSASGAYPLEVVAQDAAGNALADLITHVIAEPAIDDESPALQVAVVAEMGAPPSLQPDGTVELAEGDVDADLAIMSELAAVPDVAATLAVVPETLDGAATAGDPSRLDPLRAAAAGRAVLMRPYVDSSLEALASARLDEQVDGLLARGRLALVEWLEQEPDATTWVAEEDLGADGLAALESIGVDNVVVRDTQVEPLDQGTLALSLAKPFLVASPDSGEASGVEGFALDPQVMERLSADVPAPVLASQLLAELAVIWLEQPGVPRGAVVPVDGELPPGAVGILLRGLRSSRMLSPTTLPDLFEDLEPLLDVADAPVERELVPEQAPEISRREAAAVAETWQRLATFRSVVGPESPRTGPVVDHLLLATAVELSGQRRRAHLAASNAEMDAVTGAITLTERTTVTLTARDGTVPLTLRNGAGTPVEVVIRLRSPKLEFPGGDTIPMTLAEDSTRLDLAVRARASGAFPLEVEITSPDGSVVLASTRYTVQSTAVSGVGLVLSVGALLFLVVWWARHWRKTRRSRKLVGTDHPAVRSGAVAPQISGGGGPSRRWQDH